MKKILFCLLAFYTPVSIVIAQNTTNSPTSMFGLGELSTGEGGQYAGPVSYTHLTLPTNSRV